MMLSSQDLDLIRAAVGKSLVPLELVLHAARDEGGVLWPGLCDLAREVEGACGGYVVVVEGAVAPPELAALPAMTVRRQGEGGRIHYLALPLGAELPPFARLLQRLGQGEEEGGGEAVEVTVFMAASCPHCPQVVQTAALLAAGRRDMRLTIVDAQAYPQLAERHALRSVPATVVGTGFTLLGALREESLLGLLDGRSSGAEKAMQALVENGQLDQAVRLALVPGAGRALLPLLGAREISARLGGHAVAEEVLEQDPRALDGLVPDLVRLLGHGEPGVRGDTASLLGMIGHGDAFAALRALALDPVEDVAEAAREALESLGASGKAS